MMGGGWRGGRMQRGTGKSGKDGKQMEKQKSKEKKERLYNARGAVHKASGKCVFVNIFLLLFGQFCHRRERRGKIQ